MNKQYVIGLDYGSDSVRAILVNTEDGTTLASSVFEYPRWKEGQYCDPAKNQFRQHPLDHLEGLEETINQVTSQSGVLPGQIKAICVDTTGSSPLPVNRQGIPLALLPEFAENPDAMMVLWKDHTAIGEAEEINRLAKNWGGEDFTKYSGGIYSSEWFWAKILHISRQDDKVAGAAYTWMEHCDFITARLCGTEDPLSAKRSRCAAGHKAMWHESWGGFPPADFLDMLSPYLGEMRKRLPAETFTSDQPAGSLSQEWAQRLGLSTETVVAVGTLDAHAGAIGVGIKENTLVRVMGTSTCDMLVSPSKDIGQRQIKGICGQVDGSIIPGSIGLEAGQSAFGDVLAWFKKLLLAPSLEIIRNSNEFTAEKKEAFLLELEDNLLKLLSEKAAQLAPEDTAPLALDWINGRRTPDADQSLKGAIEGLTMGTDAYRLFLSLVEAICFGSKKIVDRFQEEGLHINSVIALGGVAQKSPLIMQTLADALDMAIQVAEEDQAPALGAAICAAAAAGIHPDFATAVHKMGSSMAKVYQPHPENVERLANKYKDYLRLGEFIEKSSKKELLQLN
ncbi:ribulokinase [Echinicola sediminis]